MKKRIPTFLIREEWILPKKPCGRALRRTRQSDPHTNRTRWISDTCVNYIKEPWCLVKKVFLRIHFHIWDTRSAWRVRESRNFPFFFSWTVFCNGKEELFLKKEIEPSSVKRLDVHIIVVFYSDVFDSEHSGLKGRKKRILLVVSPVHKRSVMKKIFFSLNVEKKMMTSYHVGWRRTRLKEKFTKLDILFLIRGRARKDKNIRAGDPWQWKVHIRSTRCAVTYTHFL